MTTQCENCENYSFDVVSKKGLLRSWDRDEDENEDGTRAIEKHQKYSHVFKNTHTLYLSI